MGQLQHLEEMLEEDAKNEALLHENADKLKQVPYMELQFGMSEFKLTLVDSFKTSQGVSVFTRDLCVDVHMFDSSSKYNRHTLEVNLVNQSFGINSIARNDENKVIETPFMQ